MSSIFPSASAFDGMLRAVNSHRGAERVEGKRDGAMYHIQWAAALFQPRPLPITGNEVKRIGSGMNGIDVSDKAVRTQRTRQFIAGEPRWESCTHEESRKSVQGIEDPPRTRGRAWMPGDRKLCSPTAQHREARCGMVERRGDGQWGKTVADVDFLVCFRTAGFSIDDMIKFQHMTEMRLGTGHFRHRMHIGTSDCPVSRVDLVRAEEFSFLQYPEITMASHNESGVSFKAADFSRDLGITWYGTDMTALESNYFAPMKIDRGLLRYPSWDDVRARGLTRESFDVR